MELPQKQTRVGQHFSPKIPATHHTVTDDVRENREFFISMLQELDMIPRSTNYAKPEGHLWTYWTQRATETTPGTGLQIDYILGKSRWKNAAHHCYAQDDGLDSDHIPLLITIKMKFGLPKQPQPRNAIDWARTKPEEIRQYAADLMKAIPRPTGLDRNNADDTYTQWKMPSKRH